MIQGKYQNKIDYEKFISDAYGKIVSNCRKLSHFGFQTCGSGALAMLTGLDPHYFDKIRPKSAAHWTDRSLIKILKSKKFEVETLTRRGITNIDPYYNDWQQCKVNRHHVLLLNVLVCRNEASYFVVTNNRIFHNFSEEELNPLYFINKPTQSAYLVTHKKWEIV